MPTLRKERRCSFTVWRESHARHQFYLLTSWNVIIFHYVTLTNWRGLSDVCPRSPPRFSFPLLSLQNPSHNCYLFIGTSFFLLFFNIVVPILIYITARIFPNIGFWKQLIEYEKANFRGNFTAVVRPNVNNQSFSDGWVEFIPISKL